MKKLAGKPGHRRLPKHEAKAEPGIPSPPLSVEKDDVALLEWNRVVALLARMGVLARVHMAALGAYCNSFSEWQRAEKEIRDNGLTSVDGNGVRRKNPAVTVSNHAKAHMRGFMVEFGMTPSAQSRINAKSSEESEKETRLRKYLGP